MRNLTEPEGISNSDRLTVQDLYHMDYEKLRDDFIAKGNAYIAASYYPHIDYDRLPTPAQFCTDEVDPVQRAILFATTPDEVLAQHCLLCCLCRRIQCPLSHYAIDRLQNWAVAAILDPPKRRKLNRQYVFRKFGHQCKSWWVWFKLALYAYVW